jgi:TetR/AcrR family fatty acid metabolism transcriptional regulator
MARAPGNSVQQHVIAARRNQILDAATRVFADKGFHRATIREVARAAGVADGTIYNYFENKTALLLGILDRLNETERRRDDLARSADMDVESFVKGYLKHRFEVLTQAGFDVFHVLLSEILANRELRDLYYRQVVEPTFAIAETYLQRWVDRGAVRPLDTQLATRALAGMVLGVLMLRLMGDPQLEARWNDVSSFLAELIIYGLDPAEGDPHASH